MKNIDIYSQPIKFRINKKDTIKTTIGGILTIITAIFAFFLARFIGLDIYFKEKPISFIQADLSSNFPKIEISNNDFPLSFILTNDENVPMLDFSYFNMKLFYIQYEMNPVSNIYSVKSKTEHKLRFCHFFDFPNISQEAFINAQLGFSLCPVNSTFSLQGHWTEKELSHIQISIEKCKNNSSDYSNLNRDKNILDILNQNFQIYNEIRTNELNIDNHKNLNMSFYLQNNTDPEPIGSSLSDTEIPDNFKDNFKCKSDKEIKNFILKSNAKLNLYYIKTKVLINNNKNPIDYTIGTTFKYLLFDGYKRTDFYLQQDYISTDNGMISSSIDKKGFLKLVDDQTDLRNADIEDYQIIAFNFFSSNVSQTYFRRYIKIHEILASVGGFLKILTIIFMFLNKYFIEVEKNISLINNAFVINKQTHQEEILKISKKPFLFSPNQNINIFSKANNDFQKNYDLSDMNTIKVSKYLKEEQINNRYVNANLNKQRFIIKSMKRNNKFNTKISTNLMTDNCPYKINNFKSTLTTKNLLLNSVNESNNILNNILLKTDNISNEIVYKQDDNNNNLINKDLELNQMQSNLENDRIFKIEGLDKNTNLSDFHKNKLNSFKNKNINSPVKVLSKLDDQSIEKLFPINEDERSFKFQSPYSHLNDAKIHENEYAASKFSKINNSIIKLNNENENDNNIHLKEKSNSLNTILIKDEKLRKYINLRKNKFVLNYRFCDKWRIICNNNCKKKPSQKYFKNFVIYDAGKKLIEKYFDIDYLIKSLKKFSLLENCFFQDYQWRILEIISKPILTTDIIINENTGTFDDKLLEFPENDIENYITYFYNKLCTRNNFIDRNMLRIMYNFENVIS